MAGLSERLLEIVREKRFWHAGPLLNDLDAPRMAEFRAAWAMMNPVERQELAHALVELAEAYAEYDFRAVFRWLLSDEDAEIRATAVQGLWEDESPALIGPLLHLLRHDPDFRVREAVATALGRFVLLAELGEVSHREVMPVIEALLDKARDPQEDVDVRRRAIESLGYIDESHIHDLIEAAYYDGDLRMQASAVFAMGRSANPRWRPYILAELESPDPELRYEAALAAGELEIPEAIPPLKVLLEDEDMEIRLAAIEALGRIGGPEAERLLVELAETETSLIADAAEDALDELRFMKGDMDFPLFEFMDMDFLEEEGEEE